VERPEPKARTNDVDAGDERRRISQEPSDVLLGRTMRTQRDVSPSPISGRGRPEEPAAGHLFAPRRRMVGSGHSQAGSFT